MILEQAFFSLPELISIAPEPDQPQSQSGKTSPSEKLSAAEAQLVGLYTMSISWQLQIRQYPISRDVLEFQRRYQQNEWTRKADLYVKLPDELYSGVKGMGIKQQNFVEAKITSYLPWVILDLLRLALYPPEDEEYGRYLLLHFQKLVNMRKNNPLKDLQNQILCPLPQKNTVQPILGVCSVKFDLSDFQEVKNLQTALRWIEGSLPDISLRQASCRFDLTKFMVLPTPPVKATDPGSYFFLIRIDDFEIQVGSKIFKPPSETPLSALKPPEPTGLPPTPPPTPPKLKPPEPTGVRVTQGSHLGSLEVGAEALIPPVVEIREPENNSKTGNSKTKMEVHVTERNRGRHRITTVQIRANDGDWEKLRQEHQRPNVVGESSIWTGEVELQRGENTIEVVAINDAGIQSEPESVTVTYRPPESSSAEKELKPPPYEKQKQTEMEPPPSKVLRSVGEHQSDEEQKQIEIERQPPTARPKAIGYQESSVSQQKEMERQRELELQQKRRLAQQMKMKQRQLERGR